MANSRFTYLLKPTYPNRKKCRLQCYITQWLQSLYLVGAACAQWKIGGKFW